MLFSVIIPTYNRLEYLKECLDSVWAQSFKDYEVIVVDDGSTDGTDVFLKGLGHRIVHLSQSNAGPGSARNLGASVANGNYLAFLDSDDCWSPCSLATYARIIEQYDSPHLIFSSWLEFSDQSSPNFDQFVELDGEWAACYLDTSKKAYFAGAGMLIVDRNQFSNVGGFCTGNVNAEDHDLALKLGTSAGFFQIKKPLTVRRRIHACNLSSGSRENAEGVSMLIENEKLDLYPGGKKRSGARRRIILNHVRPAVMSCLRSGDFDSGWHLYSSTFFWSLREVRLRYLTFAGGLMCVSALGLLKRASKDYAN